MSDSNIVQFPRDRQVRPLTEGDISASVQQVQMTAIERVVGEVFDVMMEAMCRAGYCLHDHDEDDNTIKDGALIFNAMRSAAFRKNNISHPLQKIAEDMFDDIDDGYIDEDDEEEIR